MAATETYEPWVLNCQVTFKSKISRLPDTAEDRGLKSKSRLRVCVCFYKQIMLVLNWTGATKLGIP